MTIEGIYRDGKVELLETPEDVDEARVIVTFLREGAVNLSESGIDEIQAASLGTTGDGSLRCLISAAMSCLYTFLILIFALPNAVRHSLSKPTI
jgi:hypothetical protein